MLNVQVPFFFKYAVDYYNKLPSLTSPEGTILTVGTAMLLGCMQDTFTCAHTLNPCTCCLCHSCTVAM